MTTFATWERAAEARSPTPHGALVSGEAVQVAKFREDTLSELFAKEAA
ncbi:hypothetical protein [Deinococcus alpinitundrae]|nr:hypothetical protein [Deinococcus alpinitundrae]